MSEIRMVKDRHFVAPLTDEEFKEVKVRAAKAGVRVKVWVSQAVQYKLKKEE